MESSKRPGGKRAFLPYVGAVVAVFAAAGLRSLVPVAWNQEAPPFTFFYLAVAVVAWRGGLRPALLATGLSVVAAQFFFVEPTLSPRSDPRDLLATALFVLVALLLTLFSEAERRERRRADAHLQVARKQLELLERSERDLRETTDRLQVIQRELQLLNTDLEGRVEERTREVEAANSRLRAEIGERERAMDALREQTDRLDRSNRELERFAYVSSHDLQEPLRMVVAFTQLLAQRYRGKLGADADEYISYAVDGALRMQTLIRDLLSYSRVGASARPFVPVDVARVVATALANLRAAMEESGASVEVAELPTVLGDEMELTQLFQNLLGNALKFHGERAPRVRVGREVSAAKAQPGFCTISISDNGIGIAPEYLERIFEVFQRLHTRQQYPGNGIGLAVCQKVVERHGGRIWATSEPNRGSTFRVSLPLSQDGAPRPSSPSGAGRSRETARSR
ncbi:MAG TPA: ATP-binding protein [Planctomycetota bacterium]|nr:ATP-binding protein [Planctomycetota bacterium]